MELQGHRGAISGCPPELLLQGLDFSPRKSAQGGGGGKWLGRSQGHSCNRGGHKLSPGSAPLGSLPRGSAAPLPEYAIPIYRAAPEAYGGPTCRSEGCGLPPRAPTSFVGCSTASLRLTPHRGLWGRRHSHFLIQMGKRRHGEAQVTRPARRWTPGSGAADFAPNSHLGCRGRDVGWADASGA